MKNRTFENEDPGVRDQYGGTEGEGGFEQENVISRRKLLTSMGAAGAAVVMGDLLSTPGNASSAAIAASGDDPEIDADFVLYQYDEYQPERTVGDKLRETVSVKDFGAKGDGVTDDSAAVQAAGNSLIQKGGGALYFPSGMYLMNSQVVWSLPNEQTYEFLGDGPSSIILGNNVAGALKMSSNGRQTRVVCRDLYFSPNLINSGTAFEYTAPEGGASGRRIFEMRNVTFTPAKYDSDKAWFNVITVTGVLRPIFSNVVHFRGRQSTLKSDWILNIDGCYKPHIERCYLNGRATYGVKNVRTIPAQEGGYIVETTINGADYGFYRRQSGRGPELWVTNSHFNSRIVGVYAYNAKYVWLTNNEMYCQADANADYVDYFLENCNGVIIQNNVYRQHAANQRRHIKLVSCRMIRIDDYGFHAATSVPPVLIGPGSREIELILPNKLTDYDFSSYPTKLWESHSSEGVILRTRTETITVYSEPELGSVQKLYKDSPTPAPGDTLGGFQFEGNDLAGNRTMFAEIKVKQTAAIQGAHSGSLEICTAIQGESIRQVRFDNGIVAGDTDAARGVGTMNAPNGFWAGSQQGASGTFMSQDGKTITITGGIITDIS